MAWMTFQPCFFAVEMKERMAAKSVAPSWQRKPPEIFCLTFIMRTSRSAWLLLKGCRCSKIRFGLRNGWRAKNTTDDVDDISSVEGNVDRRLWVGQPEWILGASVFERRNCKAQLCIPAQRRRNFWLEVVSRCSNDWDWRRSCLRTL